MTCYGCEDHQMTGTEGLQSWDRILLGVIGVVTVYALALVASGLIVSDAVFDPLGFGPDDGDITADAGRDYLQLIYAVLGCVIVGWMLTLAGIVLGPLRSRERWAWNTVVVASGGWFVLDTGVSVLLGFVGHALFNVAFATALAIPLAAIRLDIVRSRTG